MRISNEVARPTGGGVQFWKSGAELQINKALCWDLVSRLNPGYKVYFVQETNEVARPAGGASSSGRKMLSYRSAWLCSESGYVDFWGIFQSYLVRAISEVARPAEGYVQFWKIE